MQQNAPDNAERLAAVPAGQRHSVLIRSLADLFSVVPEHLPEDMERFEALFRPLYAQADPIDRRAVAGTLARRLDLPVAVAEDFLADETEIASLYLQAAPAPDETALLHAVVRGTCDIRRLIARRPHLSEPVVLALLVAGEEEVVADLADNPTAAIPEHLIVALEDEAETVTAEAAAAEEAAAASASALPPAFARFLAKDDADRLAELDAAIAATALGRAETVGRTAPRRAPSDLFAKACLGDRAGLAGDLAAALDVAPDFATTLVEDRGGEPLAIALAALGVDNTLATSVLLLVLPDDTRSYWRLSLLRDLHERTGWRAGAEIVDAWRPERAQPVTVLRQVDTAERVVRPGPRRRLIRPADLAQRRA